MAIRILIVLLFTPILCFAETKQELIDDLTAIGEAYWAERVVIEHSDSGKTYYGYSGNQTLVSEGTPRYYESDFRYLDEPHIFVEAENSSGHAGVMSAFIKGYEETDNKFFLRVAKSLGDTLLQAQEDNGSGGWWHDMGVMNDGVDEGSFVNYFPYNGDANADADYQEIGDLDGTSYQQALALLRLEQVLPVDDTDKGGKYLDGAKEFADMLVALKDVELFLDPDTFNPYGDGGFPQMYPLSKVMDGRRPTDFCRFCTADDYPASLSGTNYSHNAMITLNDSAMSGAFVFLGEFYKEAVTNASLTAATYQAALRLNVDYLIGVFDAHALANSRSAWATAYHFQDGTIYEDEPEWLRSMEAPGFYPHDQAADDMLVYWHQIETDSTRKTNIEDTLVNYMLFMKYEAPIINNDQDVIDIIASDGTDPSLMLPASGWTVAGGPSGADYDSGDSRTWNWWFAMNHDPALGTVGSPVGGPDPNNCHETGDNCYTRYIGDEAMYRLAYTNADAHYSYPESNYPSVSSATRSNYPGNKIYRFLDEDADPDEYDFDSIWLDNRHHLDIDQFFFHKDAYSSSKLTFWYGYLTDENIFGTTEGSDVATGMRTASDEYFTKGFHQFADAITNLGTGLITDSDGDGISDIAEDAQGSDKYDSQSKGIGIQEGRFRGTRTSVGGGIRVQ